MLIVSLLYCSTFILICFVFAADIISCIEFNEDGELLATGDKGGRVVIFQRDQTVTFYTK
jgi:hypothetical protein